MNAITLLWGPEEYLIDQRIQSFIEEISAESGETPEQVILDGDETGAAELESHLGSPSLFNLNRVIIIKHPVWLESRAKKGKAFTDIEPVLADFARNPIPGLYLILTTTSPPEKNILELFKGWDTSGLVEIKPYKPDQLLTWINREAGHNGIKIEGRAARELANSGRSMYYIANELARLGLSYPGQTITLEHLTGFDPATPDYNVFKLTDALLKKDAPQALSAFSILLLRGEPLPLLLHMIAREFFLLGRVRALEAQGQNRDEIVKQLKQQPFRVDRMLKSAFRSMDEITEVFNLLAEADRDLKSRSQNKNLIFETLIIDLCKI